MVREIDGGWMTAGGSIPAGFLMENHTSLGIHLILFCCLTHFLKRVMNIEYRRFRSLIRVRRCYRCSTSRRWCSSGSGGDTHFHATHALWWRSGFRIEMNRYKLSAIERDILAFAFSLTITIHFLGKCSWIY